MIDQEAFQFLAPLAYQWAKDKEQFILERGAPLGSGYIADARRAGIKDVSRIKILVVDRIPLPDHKDLAAAARQADIITDTSRAITIGHGIIIRADCWGDRELIVHQLVHIAQCERSGGLKSYLQEYLCDRYTCAQFTLGSFEQEARGLAREICAAEMVAT